MQVKLQLELRCEDIQVRDIKGCDFLFFLFLLSLGYRIDQIL